MALRDLLVCLDATAAGDGRLELALNLAQADKAHLSAVYALPEHRGSAAPLAGMGLPPTVLSPVSPEGARAIGGKPISAPAPAERAWRHLAAYIVRLRALPSFISLQSMPVRGLQIGATLS